MKHEERTPMKLLQTLKTYATNALMILVSVVCALVFITILMQAISLTFFAATFCAAVGFLAYLYWSKS